MSLHAGVYTYLQTVTALTNHVSARIYPNVAPQDAARPYIVYQQVSSDHPHHLTAATGKTRVTLQFDVIAETPDAANTVADELRKAMDGYRGAMGSADVRTCHLQSDLSDATDPTNDSQQGLHRRILDFSLWYSTTVPTFA